MRVSAALAPRHFLQSTCKKRENHHLVRFRSLASTRGSIAYLTPVVKGLCRDFFAPPQNSSHPPGPPAMGSRRRRSTAAHTDARQKRLLEQSHPSEEPPYRGESGLFMACRNRRQEHYPLPGGDCLCVDSSRIIPPPRFLVNPFVGRKYFFLDYRVLRAQYIAIMLAAPRYSGSRS